METNFITIAFDNRTADIYPYYTPYDTITNVLIVTGNASYDCDDGNTYILIFREILNYGIKTPHRFIDPNQIHHVGVEFWDNPYDKHHGISIEGNDTTTTSINYQSNKLSFKLRVPNKEKLSPRLNIHRTRETPW